MTIKIVSTIASILVVVLPTKLFAADTNFYTGVEMGESKVYRTSGNLNVESVPVQTDPGIMIDGPAEASVDNDGYGGRAYVGYHFSSHFALESGYTQYADTKIKNIYGLAGKNEQLDEGALDSVMKYTIPFSKRFDVYGKGGASFVMTNKIEGAQAANEDLATSLSCRNESIDRVRPTYSVGIDYEVNSFLNTDLSWGQVSGGYGVPTSDLMALGLSFHLPNKQM